MKPLNIVLATTFICALMNLTYTYAKNEIVHKAEIPKCKSRYNQMCYPIKFVDSSLFINGKFKKWVRRCTSNNVTYCLVCSDKNEENLPT